MTYLAIGCRAMLAVVFLVSGLGKARGRSAFGAFARSVRDLRLLPGPVARPAAVAVVVAELACVPLLAVPGAPGMAFAGPVLAGTLIACFSAAMVIARRRGSSAECHCFGRASGPFGPRHLARNAFLGAVAVAGSAAAAAPAGPVRPAGLAATLAVASIATLTVLTLDELVELFVA